MVTLTLFSSFALKQELVDFNIIPCRTPLSMDRSRNYAATKKYGLT